MENKKRILKRHEMLLLSDIQKVTTELIFNHEYKFWINMFADKIQIVEYDTYETIEHGLVWLTEWNKNITTELEILLDYLIEMKEGK